MPPGGVEFGDGAVGAFCKYRSHQGGYGLEGHPHDDIAAIADAAAYAARMVGGVWR